MLRPATPLAVLLLIAFALLLISTISAPIINGISLASFDGVDFGVFGYCQGSSCSGIKIGYDLSSLYDSSQDASFDFSDSVRHTVSAVLIFHPIAALFSLFMLILAITAHFHSPSHSPRYLLGVFILSLFTVLLSLLAFLVDILLFAPHMAWGSWIVLAATVVIGASCIVSCAMRRTLVSRKARKRRIEENAEMNGENFYNRQAAIPAPVDAIPLTGTTAEKMPSFATFESAKVSDRTSDERVPLTARSPSERSANGRPTDMNGGLGSQGGFRGPSPAQSFNRPPPQRDEFGNIIPSRNGDPALRQQYSNGSMRGRGGYGPGPGPGRGNFGPYRGGYGGPGRGGYGPGPGPYRGPGPMRGRGGGPPMGYPGRGMGPPPQGGPGFNRVPSPGNYGSGPQAGPYGRRPSASGELPVDLAAGAAGGAAAAGAYGAYNNSPRDSLPRAESPPPLPGESTVGQAVEMDETTGSPALPTSANFASMGGLRDSDGDVAGMVGLQQQRLQNVPRHNTVMSETSRYSNDEPYVPVRAQWDQQGRTSPLNIRKSPAPATASPVQDLSLARAPTNASDGYYEDVAPQFASNEPIHLTASSTALPVALTPGGNLNISNNSSSGSSRPELPRLGEIPEGSDSYEEIQHAPRSPAESESNFTSISQREINPRWNPNYGNYPGPPRGPPPQQQRRDILLNSNPDFELPTGRSRGRGTNLANGGRMPGVGPF